MQTLSILQYDSHERSRFRCRDNVHFSPDQLGALVQAEQAEMSAGSKFGRIARHLEPFSIIPDLDPDFLRLEFDRKVGLGGAGMPDHVADRLLSHPIEGQLHLGR